MLSTQDLEMVAESQILTSKGSRSSRNRLVYSHHEDVPTVDAAGSGGEPRLPGEKGREATSNPSAPRMLKQVAQF